MAAMKTRNAKQRGRLKRKLVTAGVLAGLAAGLLGKAVLVDSRTGRTIGAPVQPKKHAEQVRARENGFQRRVKTQRVSLGGGWPKVLELFKWDPNHPFVEKRIALIDRISKAERVSPSQVMRAIRRNGTKWYHAKALHSILEAYPKEIAKRKQQLFFAGLAGNKDIVEKLERRIADLEKEIAKAKADVGTLDFLLKERDSSKGRKAVVTDTVISIQSRPFIRKQLEVLADGQK